MKYKEIDILGTELDYKIGNFSVNIAEDNSDYDTYNIEPQPLYIFLTSKFPIGFDKDKVVLLNKTEIKLDDFDTFITNDDVVTVLSLPKEPFSSFLIGMVISLVVAYLIKILFPPHKPDTLPNSHSVYNANINQIQANIGEPIGIQYGQIRSYTKLIAPIYKILIEEQEYTIIHTCLGVGDYDIVNAFIGDTNINMFEAPALSYYKQGTGSKSGYLDSFRNIASTNYGLDTRMISLITHTIPEAAGTIPKVGKLTYNQRIPVSQYTYVDGATNITIYGVVYNFQAITFSIPNTGMGDIEPMVTIKMYDGAGSSGYYVVNPVNTIVDRIMVNYAFNGGIFSVDDKGNEESDTAKFQFNISEIDDNDVLTGYSYTENHNFQRATKSKFSSSVLVPVKPGRYKVKIVRLDTPSARGTKEGTIDGIFGFESDQGLTDVDSFTLISYIVKTNGQISGQSGTAVNIDTIRVGGNYSTLRDLVLDLWTNIDYGMGMSLEYLEIRGQLNNEISYVIDKRENVFDTINSVLKSFGYVIYPYLNKFIIKLETLMPYRSMVFSSKNTKEITFTYNLQADDDLVKGVKGKYLPKGEANLSTFYFPDDPSITDFDETILPGVNNIVDAQKICQFLYNKKTKILKTCSIKTDIEGLIPELYSRVGVATEYLENYITCEGYQLTTTTIQLSQYVTIDPSEDNSIVIYSSDGVAYDKMQVISSVPYTNTLTIIGGDTINFTNSFYVNIGLTTKVIEDYVITSIAPGKNDDDINRSMEVAITLMEYDESVYVY
jgi:hypothetical protein